MGPGLLVPVRVRALSGIQDAEEGLLRVPRSTGMPDSSDIFVNLNVPVLPSFVVHDIILGFSLA